MMRDRDDLKTQWRHVGCQARFDDRGRIDALVAEMREALVVEAADGAENLQVVGDGRVVERKSHGVCFPLFGLLCAAQFTETSRIAIAGECRSNVRLLTIGYRRNRQGSAATGWLQFAGSITTLCNFPIERFGAHTDLAG